MTTTFFLLLDGSEVDSVHSILLDKMKQSHHVLKVGSGRPRDSGLELTVLLLVDLHASGHR
jgi:hypothetical protein